MLDQDILNQLKTVFEKLESSIQLVYNDTTHEDQNSLTEMLEALTRTSSKISTKKELFSGNTAPPEFKIFKNNQFTGIHFKGIPGGHEFTSLILAILNSDFKGKMPEEFIANRIKNLKGPIHIKTFMSLTCENCPEVIQAINQMAILHGSIHHEIIDGGYFQDEISKLGIQGVPSLVSGVEIFHSGRINLLDLLTKLETQFGINSNNSNESLTPKDLGKYDVVVLGAGPAGSASAIYSVRKGLKTALIGERFGGQVQDTQGIENLIGITYTVGPQLAQQLNQHVKSYPVDTFEHRRIKAINKETKEITFESGETINAGAIIIATGAKWRELNVPGEKEYMGRGVAYCPHCDGPFYKGKKVAVVGGGNSGVEAAIDLAGIVREVVLIEFNAELRADKVLVDKLKSMPNTSIITNAKTLNIEGDGTQVKALNYLDRQHETERKVELDGVFVQIGLVPNSQFVQGIVETTKFGEIIIDNKCRTNVPGIYAAGDVTTVPYKQIVIAMGEGAKAALTAFEDKMFHG